MAKPEAWDHPKIRKLGLLLRLPRYGAYGLAVGLWELAHRYTPAGDIGKLSDEEIASMLDWDRDPQGLIDAFLAARLLDKAAKSRGRLHVHDWAEHAGDLTHAKLARAKRFFVTGESPNFRKLGKEERDEAERYFGQFEPNSWHPAGSRRGRSPSDPSQSNSNKKNNSDFAIKACPEAAPGAESSCLSKDDRNANLDTISKAKQKMGVNSERKVLGEPASSDGGQRTVNNQRELRKLAFRELVDLLNDQQE